MNVRPSFMRQSAVFALLMIAICGTTLHSILAQSSVIHVTPVVDEHIETDVTNKYSTNVIPLANQACQLSGNAHSGVNFAQAAKQDEPRGKDVTEKIAEDRKRQDAINKKAIAAHKPLFFDNDFSYLCDPNYNGCLLGDRFKQRCLPGCGWYDIGGEFRMRYHSERNMRGLGLTGVDDDFLLYRTRVYGNFQLNDDVRVFGEFLDADSNYENFAPRPIEVNRHEIQNLFVDLRLLAEGDNSVTARVGRQELLLGAQRAVSPLDWANTRRTFEGARLLYQSNDYSFDAFWTHPVRVDDRSFDSPDRDQEFMGCYSSLKCCENQTFDTYFLRLLNGRDTNQFEYNTVGSRWHRTGPGLMWDIEAAYQFGKNTNRSDHAAGMLTMGVGHKIACHSWDPTIWLFYDYASGDQATGAGNGFHHHFPLAHKYNGFMDLFGRRNLEDVNAQLSIQPTKRLKLLAWYHYLFLATQSDTPYSVVMTPFNAGNAPGSADLGHEIDLLASVSVGPRSNIVLGWSHFFSGQYYQNTNGVPFAGDGDFFYSQFTVNF